MLIFQIQPRKSSELILGVLRLQALQVEKEWHHVTSGIPGCQSRSDCWRRGVGILPPNEEVEIGGRTHEYVVLTGSSPASHPRQAGQSVYAIWPRKVVCRDDPSLLRTDCAIHLDANYAASPGSGGCIVFTGEQGHADWQDFQTMMAALKAQGINEVPLTVRYLP